MIVKLKKSQSSLIILLISQRKTSIIYHFLKKKMIQMNLFKHPEQSQRMNLWLLEGKGGEGGLEWDVGLTCTHTCYI